MFRQLNFALIFRRLAAGVGKLAPMRVATIIVIDACADKVVCTLTYNLQRPALTTESDDNAAAKLAFFEVVIIV